ncbi:MAG: lysophospholipid acyltransferase family protein [Archangium sp.]
MARDEAVSDLVERLELPFNQFGVDPYGISKKHLKVAFGALSFFYRRYFRVKAVGIENVPPRGRAMLVGNHSGGYAIDGAMVLTSMMLEMTPPRLAQGMVEKFMNQLPVSSLWSSRTGQLTGLPEHAERLLQDDRLLMVFPEGAKGTAKLFKDRYSLVDFGTGFVRLALKTRTPIVPLGFVGGGDAVPTIRNSRTLGKLMGVPYVPITPYGVAAPLPAKLVVHYGKPMFFEGTGDEEDAVVKGYVDQVKARIAELIEAARGDRRGLQGRV